MACKTILTRTHLIKSLRTWNGDECKKLSNDQYKELSAYMEDAIGFYEPKITGGRALKEINNDLLESELDHIINSG